MSTIEIVIAVLLGLWLFGLVFKVAGKLIHILLLVALIVLILRALNVIVI